VAGDVDSEAAHAPPSWRARAIASGLVDELQQ